MSQIHSKFTSDQVKELLTRYSRDEIERKYIQEILGIKRRRFFALVKQYRENPKDFTIEYQRASHPRISQDLEKNMLRELSVEKKIIQNKDIPLETYIKWSKPNMTILFPDNNLCYSVKLVIKIIFYHQKYLLLNFNKLSIFHQNFVSLAIKLLYSKVDSMFKIYKIRILNG